MGRSANLSISITSVLFLLLPGCLSSGQPKLVKISPDSRFIAYEDARYPRVYVYDVKKQSRHDFPGVIAFANRSTTRLVLLPDTVQNLMDVTQIRPTLVRLGADGISSDRLPPLAGKPRIWHIAFHMDDEQDDLAVLIVRTNLHWPRDRREYWVLDSVQPSWSERASLDLPFATREDLERNGPTGVRDTGPVYCPTQIPSGSVIDPVQCSAGVGLDVEEESARRQDSVELQFRLSSPDGRYFVTINDSKDPWRRVWLTMQSDQRRIILLDKNDVPAQIAIGVIGAPSYALMVLYMWLFNVHI